MQIDDVSRIIFCVQTTMNNGFFSNIFFCYQMCTIHFPNGRRPILMVKKEKNIKIGKIHLKTHLDAFFSNVSLTQVIHFYVIQSMDA
jgi:hypothetical protein